jgi:tetratricopeptide (TPR) repeat protein
MPEPRVTLNIEELPEDRPPELEGQISESTYRKVRRDEPVLLSTARVIADGLDKPVECLIDRQVYSSRLSFLPLEDFTPEDERQLHRAIEADRAGDQERAVRICDRLKAKLDEDSGAKPYHKAVVDISKANYLNNMNDGSPRGIEKSKEAITILDTLLDSPLLDQVPEDVRLWTAYQKAISLYRLQEYDAAKDALRSLIGLQSGPIFAAANHQLGVVYLQESRGTDRLLLEKAMEHFTLSQRHWQREHNHREGFSLRRMGQIYALQRESRKAAECFVQAIIIFARSGCHRYVDMTVEDLERHVFPELR